MKKTQNSSKKCRNTTEFKSHNTRMKPWNSDGITSSLLFTKRKTSNILESELGKITYGMWSQEWWSRRTDMWWERVARWSIQAGWILIPMRFCFKNSKKDIELTGSQRGQVKEEEEERSPIERGFSEIREGSAPPWLLSTLAEPQLQWPNYLRFNHRVYKWRKLLVFSGQTQGSQ